MKYSPPLDGIRALAILAVLVYHAFPGALPGGFTGVDVFFVLSGYLIASVILFDLREGSFTMREFYLRRIQRLLPNAAATVLVTVALAAWLLVPSEAAKAAKNGLFALLNLSNLYIWKSIGGYWGDTGEYAPFLHTWSLAVEEQFYLFFPALLLLLARRRPRGSAIPAAVGVLAAASFVLSMWGMGQHPAATFYLLPTRAWEPLLGALLAALRVPSSAAAPLRPFRPSRAKDLLGWAGVAAILSASFLLSGAQPYPGLVALLPTLGAADFTLDKASLSIAPGSPGCVKATPTTAALAAAGYHEATLQATFESGEGQRTISAKVAVLVSSASQPSPGTVLRTAASKLNFSAPAGQTPLPTTLGVSIVPPPQAGQTIELVVTRAPSWLVVEQPEGGLKLDASGQIVLKLQVDRARRAYAGAPQSGELELELAAASPRIFVAIPVLDMEPWGVEAGQGSTRNSIGPIAAMDTPDESPGSFFIASAVEAEGLEGAFFSSDGWLRNNTDVDDLPAELWFTPAGKDGTADPNVLKVTTAFKANRTVRLSSLLTTVFGLPPGSTGMVELKSRFAGAFSLRSRTQSDTGGDPALRFGAEMPGVFVTDGVDASGGEAVVPGVVSTSASRTNLILANPTKQGVTAKVTVRSADGQTTGTVDGVYVPPFSRQQIDGVATAAGFPSLPLGSLSVAATAGGGRVVPIASVIDNDSNSFSHLKGRRVGSGAFRALIVPGVVRVTGANDTRYRTALRIANGTATPAQLQLVYGYVDLDLGGKTGEARVNVTIPPFGSLPLAQSEDALAELFGQAGQTYGWIAIEGEASKVAAAAAVSAQVDNADPGKGRTAAQLAAIPSTGREITSLGAPSVRFAGAEKNAMRRSNLVLVETAGAPATVRVTLTDLLGTVIGTKEIALRPFEYAQVNDLFGPTLFDVGDGPFSEMEVAASVTAGNGRVLSFVSSIVNASRNPEIYLLAPSGP